MTTTTRKIPDAKSALLSEGLKLFASHGVDAVSIREIAKATGFSNPALFRHFPGKEALATALFEACYRRLVEALEAAAAKGGLQAWLAAGLGEIAAAPEAVLFVLDNLKRYFATLPSELQARNLPRQITAMIHSEQAAGRMRQDLDVRMAVTVIAGALGQLARSAHFREVQLDATATAADLAGLLAQGLAPGEITA